VLKRCSPVEKKLVGAVGSNYCILKRRKLLILRNGKNEKYCTNAEPRYTAGTPIHRRHSLGVPYYKWPTSTLANHRFYSFGFARKLLLDHPHRYNFFINHHEFRRRLRQQQSETSLGSVLDLCNGKAGNGLKVFHVQSDDAEAEMQGRGSDDEIGEINADPPSHLFTMDAPSQPCDL
jgi:hypothetical protein